MSNSSFSELPEDLSEPLSEPLLDLQEDPPVDKELRDIVRRFSVGPTAEEQERFWADLSEKLPEQKVSAKTFAKPSRRRYLPWTALASGIVVVLLLLVQPSKDMSKQAILSDAVEQESFSAAESEPMVLGAPPPAAHSNAHQKKESKRDIANVDVSAPFGLASPDFQVRWERRSDQVFWVHISLENKDRLLALAKQWPSGLILSKVSDSEGEEPLKTLTYRLEDQR